MKPFTRWFPLLILAAGIVAYANSFAGPFLFDDTRVIIENPHLYTPWPPWKAVWAPTRWVADVSFAWNHALGASTPADYRIANVLIHVLAALLLYGVVRRTLVRPRFRARFGAVADPLACVAALLWVTHPLQTESVTYISQRIEALVSLFILLVLYGFIRGLDSPRPRLWMNGALAACIAGMGTKELMATVPVLVLLYDAWAGAGSWREAVRLRWKFHLALFLSIGVFVMLFVKFSAMAMDTGGLIEKGIDPRSYALTQTEVILHYFRLCIVPAKLCLSYRWPIAHSLLDIWPSAVALGALLGLTAWGAIRGAAFAFPLAAVFVILAPTSSIMPLSDAAFEHRMYLPLAGVLSLVTVGGYALLEACSRRWPRRAGCRPALALLLAAAVAALFVSLTRTRNLDYRSMEAMWQDVLAKYPDNHRVRVALSSALISAERYDEATALLTNMLPRLPDFPTMSLDRIRREYEQDPMLPAVEYAMAHNNLGVISLSRLDWNAAEPHFREVIRVWPNNYLGYFNMGRVAAFQFKTNAAMEWWQAALRRKPDDVDTLCLLGGAHAAAGDYTNALAYYDGALRTSPNHPVALSRLAWMLATCPDPGVRNGPRAVRLAEVLPALSGAVSAHACDVLAAALAEAGRFDEAIACAGKALDLLGRPESGRPAEVSRRQEIAERLELYRRRQPYRDTP